MSIQSFSIAGRVALISGGGTGIGKALALAFADAGASVFLLGRREEPLAATAAEITTRGGHAGLAVGDVSEPAACRLAVAECVRRFGALHILVNNAGKGQFTKLLDTDDALIDQMIGTNLRGAVLLTKYASSELARHRDHGGGSILNIASVAAHRTLSSGAVYAATKSGLVQLTRCLALELAPLRIRVNCISPGAVDTPALASDGIIPAARAAEFYAKRTPLGRMADPMELAPAALFLCGPSAEWITGAVLRVDGGLSLV